MKLQRIEFLDYAKGFSMLSIVFFHYYQFAFGGIFQKAVTFGGSGVHLFFLLSGFGLGLSSQNLTILSFLKKRFVRILIPYYIFIVFVFVINIFLDIYPGDGTYAFWGHILLFKMLDESIVTSYGYHLWFISAIIQFYLIFPILMFFKRKMSLLQFGLFTLFISVFYWIITTVFELNHLLTISNSAIQFIWEFSLGIILADLYLKNNFKFWDQKIIFLLIFMVLGISLLGIMAIKGGEIGRTLNDIPALVGFTSMVILSFKILKKIKPLKRIILFIGNVSFELYLVHMVVYYLYSRILSTSIHFNFDTVYLKVIIILPTAILISLIFNRLNAKLTKQLISNI